LDHQRNAANSKSTGQSAVPKSKYVQRNLDFQITQVSDCFIVSSEVSPAGAINLINYCWTVVLLLLHNGFLCRGYVTKGPISHTNEHFIGTGYHKALEHEANVTAFKREADERGTPFVEIDTVVCDYVDKNQPIPKVRAMTSFVSDDLGSTRFFSVFLGTLAGAALLLALIGIYGALSLSVGQRTREIAVRAAMGAERMSIFKLVMKESLLVVLVAEVIGMAGAMILGRFLSTLLFGVTPVDPITLATVGLVSAMTAFAASYVPTRSAMGVDPAIILRGE